MSGAYVAAVPTTSAVIVALTWGRGRRAVRRLRSLGLGDPQLRQRWFAHRGGGRRHSTETVRSFGCVLVASAALAVVGLPWGPPAAVVIWWMCRRWVRTRPSAAQQRRLRYEQRKAPLVAEFLAAALCAGAPLRVALAETGNAIGGAVGVRLTAAARVLEFGGIADDCWERNLAGPSVDAARVGALVAASEREGFACESALRAVADDLRAQSAARAAERARRAGIRVVAPLGLCFLPAFVLVAIVPIVAASFRGLSI